MTVHIMPCKHYLNWYISLVCIFIVKVLLVRLDLQGTKVPLALLVHLDKKERKVQLEPPVTKVLLDKPVHQAMQGFLDSLECKARKAAKDHKDLQDQREIQARKCDTFEDCFICSVSILGGKNKKEIDEFITLYGKRFLI